MNFTRPLLASFSQRPGMCSPVRGLHSSARPFGQYMYLEIDVQYQRSESDGEISITGDSDRSDGKNVYRRRNVCQLRKHDITML